MATYMGFLQIKCRRGNNSLVQYTSRLPYHFGVKNSVASAGDSGLISDWEDPLGKERATHSSILTWKMLWTEEPGGLECIGSQNSQT